MVAINRRKGVAFLRTYALIVDRNILNMIAVVGSNGKGLVIAFFNCYSTFRRDAAVFASNGSNLIIGVHTINRNRTVRSF